MFPGPYVSKLESEIISRLLSGSWQADSADQWKINTKELTDNIRKDGLRKFLRFPVVLRTMFVTNRLYIVKELLFVKRFLEKNNRSLANLYEVPVGYPHRYVFYPMSSGNVIHHAYSLMSYLDTTKKTINDFDFVFEFGGGYGNLCRLFRNLGYGGDYVIFDLRELSILQEYYLKTLDQYCGTNIYYGDGKTSLIYNFDELSDMSGANILFVALWSLSEAPLSVRGRVENILLNSTSILIGMQDSFASIDNLNYFESLPFSKPLIRKMASNLDKNQCYMIR
jgi:hypothetical protein